MQTLAYSRGISPTFEHRSIGTFSAAEVRDFAPGLGYAVTIGCPLDIAQDVMLKNAANRAARAAGRAIPVVAASAPARHKFTPTDAQRNAVLDRVRRIRLANSAAAIAAQERQFDALNPTLTVTDDERRRKAEETAATIRNDEIEAWRKQAQFS